MANEQLKATRISLYVFAVYMVIMGLVLLLLPNLILPIFDLPTDGNVWIRLLGFVLLCSSVYYIGAAKMGFVAFAKWTVYTRLSAPILVVILIASEVAPMQMASFGIVDGLGGLWTWLALKKDIHLMK